MTVTELLVASAIAIGAMATVLTVFVQVSGSAVRVEKAVSERMEVRNIVAQLYRETRSTAYLHVALPHEFEFTYRSHASGDKTVRYSFDSGLGVLQKTELDSGKTVTLSSVISDAQFSYYDRFGKPVVSSHASNVNVNAIQLTFHSHYPTPAGLKKTQLESPVIMFRNKTLVSSPPTDDAS